MGDITLEEARKRARARRAMADAGLDPLAESEKAKGLPTWKKWTETYLSRAEKSLRSVGDVRRYLARTLPKWGAKKLDEITPANIAALRDAQKGNAAPNRFRAAVSACFAVAVREGYVSANPAERVQPLPEPEARRRMPSDAEMRKLLDAIDGEAEEDLKVLFWLLALTGMRGSEARLLKWENVDLSRGTLRIPRAKSGREEDVPLTSSLVEMLKELPHRGPYVFPGKRKPRKAGAEPPAGGGWKARFDLQEPWRRILRRARLEGSGLHLHDLRRRAGRDLTDLFGTRRAADVLRHSDERVTRKHYSPSGAESLRSAVEERERTLLVRVKRTK